MITVNGWCAGGKGGGVSVQSMGEMGKDICLNFLQPFLEIIDRGSCNDGSRELIPVYHNPHCKCRPSPSHLGVPKVNPLPSSLVNIRMHSFLYTLTKATPP